MNLMNLIHVDITKADIPTLRRIQKKCIYNRLSCCKAHAEIVMQEIKAGNGRPGVTTDLAMSWRYLNKAFEIEDEIAKRTGNGAQRHSLFMISSEEEITMFFNEAKMKGLV